MLLIDETTKQINLTRGDYAPLEFGADNNGTPYIFQPGDVVRFKVFKAKDCGCVVLQKDVTIEEATEIVRIDLTKDETKIDDIISKPVKYWYEVELNPDTNPQTFICYDQAGEKIFMLYPEGEDKK